MNTGVFEILVLGSNGALPAYDRYPSSQVLNLHEHLILLDCGEASQFQMRKYGVKFSRIQHIFISHLHGDHVYGLPGLITSYMLLGRTEPLHVYGPPGIEEYLEFTLSKTSMQPPYPLHVHTIHQFYGEKIMENDHMTVTSLPLDHKIACCGFLIREKRPRKKLNTDKIKSLNISIEKWKWIEAGRDVTADDGQLYANEELVLPDEPLRAYAYCSDTRYTREILPFIQGVSLLYHETTYLSEMEDLAHAHGHSTAAQAARVADQARVKWLMAGHYSSRYANLEPILKECQSIFPPTLLAVEGQKVSILPDETLRIAQCVNGQFS